MDTIIVSLIIAVTALILFWQWRTIRQAKQCVGKETPDTAVVDENVSSANRVYFFHSAQCGPCRSITPMVDNLRKEYPNLIKVDVVAHTDLTTAFGIAATPSFIVVQAKRICEVKLGPVSETWLRGKLAPEA